MLKIGCHLSISNGFLQTAHDCLTINGNTYQYFSRNPRGGAQKPIDKKDIKDFLEYAKRYNMTTLLCHAPYTLNACSADEGIREFAKTVFIGDLKLLSNFPDALYNFHPGSHVGQGEEIAIKQTSDILNQVMTHEMTTTILLETMSGKGSEIGKTFEEIKAIIDKVECKEHLGVCLDTCHVYCAGYDIVNKLDKVIDHFDRVIGLDKLKAIHLNDSMMPFDSHKDRHAKIGEGTIGLDAIVRIINHPKLKDIPFYLETPCKDLLEYKTEIDLLRSKYIY